MLWSEYVVFFKEMQRIKLNTESDEVGNTYKVIAISLKVGLNITISTCFFYFQDLQNKLSIKISVYLMNLTKLNNNQ